MNNSNRWLHIYQPRPNAKVRLFCFHYAGGASNIYRKWANLLPEEVELCAVQLPGRWERASEPCFTRIADLIPPMHEAIAMAADRPIALLGYSLGGIVAFEWARHLQSTCPTLEVKRLFIISRSAPHFQRENPSSYIYNLPEDQFIKAMAENYQGIPQALMDSAELREVFLPVLRADMEMYETYQCVNGKALNVPITVMAGDEDPGITVERLNGWAEHSMYSVDIRRLPGGHFFAESNVQNVLNLIGEQILASNTPM